MGRICCACCGGVVIGRLWIFGSLGRVVCFVRMIGRGIGRMLDVGPGSGRFFESRPDKSS